MKQKTVLVKYKNFKIPIDPLAVATIYGMTLKELQTKNPWLTHEQANNATKQLIPEIIYKTYILGVKMSNIDDEILVNKYVEHN